MANDLTYLPERPSKIRKKGITMVMDKGLSIREAEDMVSSSGEYIDYVKLGFGTSTVMKNIDKKIQVFQEAKIKVYLGGTLFEAYYIRNQFNDYLKLIAKYKLDTLEISDGSVMMEHEVKCDYIRRLSKDYTVLSEVGSKEAGIIIAPNKWIKMMTMELEAGSAFVIAEARESGTVGIYRPSGVAHIALVNKILSKVPQERIIWEAPLKSQQAWFIKHIGPNVNLGNIATNDVISLETLRLGLRGDTFFNFLPPELRSQQQK